MKNKKDSIYPLGWRKFLYHPDGRLDWRHTLTVQPFLWFESIIEKAVHLLEDLLFYISGLIRRR